MNRLLLTLAAAALSASALLADETKPVSATVRNDGTTTINNGLIQLNIGSNGRVTLLKKAGTLMNLLAANGIYFDYTAAENVSLSPDSVAIVKQNDDYFEVVYANTKSDLRISQGFIVRRGDSALYTYVVVRGSANSSNINLREARVCTRLAESFTDGYVDETMNGRIPTNSEMKTAEQEENTIQDATYRLADGSIYTKYNWGQYIDRDLFHGLMNNRYGIWNIPVSYEWLNGGPMRQELTVHATSKSPITIQMLQGEHFGAKAQPYHDGDVHLYGPFMIYLNEGKSREEMIADARGRATQARAEWPFGWFDNDLYPTVRSTVKGRLRLPDSVSPEGMKMVLADSEDTKLFHKGRQYIFWANADADGNFEIPDVRPGSYSLYAYATKGHITDQLKHDGIVVAEGGAAVDLGDIDWTPADLHSTLLWQIGENNRMSDGFKFSDKPRAYGDWNDVPAALTYNVGTSKPEEDWYYAQTKNGSWNISFNLAPGYSGDAYLSASVAGATNNPRIEVQANGTKITNWSFYNDGAIYRSAKLGGRHSTRYATIPAASLKPGETNTITLKMSGIGRNGGVMWDCVKLMNDNPSAIGEISVEPTTGAADEVIGLYNLQGIRVDRATALPGLYIERTATSARKVIL